MSKLKNSASALASVQKLVFLFSVFMLPMTILPLPWDITELPMGLEFFLFATIFFGLEIVKLLITNRLDLFKSNIDSSMLLIVLAVLLSLIFSISKPVSLWGFDYRMGSGALVTILLGLYMYLSRSVINTEADLKRVVNAFSLGAALMAVFSIFSFFGYNVLSFVPLFDKLFTTGLPAYSSARISLIVWGVLTLLNVGLLSFKEKQKYVPLMRWGYILVFLTASTLFSINQGFWIQLLLVVALVLSLVLPFLKKRPLKKKYVWNTLAVILLASCTFVATRFDYVRDIVVRDDINVITQIPLSTDQSWQLTSSALSEGVVNGAFGMGYDSFSIIFNRFRPLSDDTLVLNNTNFTYANNQVLTFLASTGIVGLLVWAYVGYAGVKNLIVHIKALTLVNVEEILLIVLDLSVLFVWGSSFFAYFNFMAMFSLFLLFALQGLMENLLLNKEGDKLVLSLGVFVEKGKLDKMRTFSTGAIFVVVASVLYTLFLVGKSGAALKDVLKAEYITVDGRIQLQENKLSDTEKEQVLVDTGNLYGKAVNKMPKNYVLHRRASLIVSQYVELLASEYNSVEDAEEKEALFNEISKYLEIMIEESKNATDLAPNVYTNWAARGDIYGNLVGLGLTTYSRSAIASLDKAIELNPLNYDLYYSAAQLYVVQNDIDSALRLLNQVFTINPVHVPSLVLAAEISLSDGDNAQAERYFSAAKSAMDQYDNTELSLYDYVVDELVKLDGSSTNTVEENTDAGTDTTTEGEV